MTPLGITQDYWDRTEASLTACSYVGSVAITIMCTCARVSAHGRHLFERVLAMEAQQRGSLHVTGISYETQGISPCRKSIGGLHAPSRESVIPRLGEPAPLNKFAHL